MLPAEPPKPTYSAAPMQQRKAGSSKAMKLGGKNKDVDSFVDQVRPRSHSLTHNNSFINALSS